MRHLRQLRFSGVGGVGVRSTFAVGWKDCIDMGISCKDIPYHIMSCHVISYIVHISFHYWSLMLIDDGGLYSMIHDASALRMSLMWGAAGCLPYRSRFWMFLDVLRLQVMCVFPSQDASPTGPTK